jgi:hypothetical protein
MPFDSFQAQAAGMSKREWRANCAAEFYPIGGQEPAQTLPAVKMAGAMVFVYVKDGRLRVSVDLDEAGEFFPDPVPMEITVQGQAVFDSDSI